MRGDGDRCDWLIRTERFCACVVAAPAPARCLGAAEEEEREQERGRGDDSQTQVFTSYHVRMIQWVLSSCKGLWLGILNRIIEH